MDIVSPPGSITSLRTSTRAFILVIRRRAEFALFLFRASIYLGESSGLLRNLTKRNNLRLKSLRLQPSSAGSWKLVKAVRIRKLGRCSAGACAAPHRHLFQEILKINHGFSARSSHLSMPPGRGQNYSGASIRINRSSSQSWSTPDFLEPWVLPIFGPSANGLSSWLIQH